MAKKKEEPKVEVKKTQGKFIKKIKIDQVQSGYMLTTIYFHPSENINDNKVYNIKTLDDALKQAQNFLEA